MTGQWAIKRCFANELKSTLAVSCPYLATPMPQVMGQEWKSQTALYWLLWVINIASIVQTRDVMGWSVVVTYFVTLVLLEELMRYTIERSCYGWRQCVPLERIAVEKLHKKLSDIKAENSFQSLLWDRKKVRNTSGCMLNCLKRQSSTILRMWAAL